MNDPTPATSPSAPNCALWLPAWHELDQGLVVGLRQRFFFQNRMPESGGDREHSNSAPEWVFYRELDAPAPFEARFAVVSRIVHSQLGDILRVDTDGLDYIVYPAEGPEIVVDAEEDPGTVLAGEADGIDDWRMKVWLEQVSEPLGEGATPAEGANPAG